MAKPPPLSLWLREFPHTAQIVASPLRRARPVAEVRSGEGQPVLVFPGILSNDQSTSLLRRTLQVAGYHAHRSKLGFVTGVTLQAFEQAEQRLLEINQIEGRKPVLLGWSLGGIFSRVLAQRHPDKVAMVVTMGSPFSGDRQANNAWRIYNAINDHTVDSPTLPDDPSVKPNVHTVAVWSQNDGVIAPECARGQAGERDVAIEVATRHFAFGSDRKSIDEIVGIIGDQLTKAVRT